MVRDSQLKVQAMILIAMFFVDIIRRRCHRSVELDRKTIFHNISFKDSDGVFFDFLMYVHITHVSICLRTLESFWSHLMTETYFPHKTYSLSFPTLPIWSNSNTKWVFVDVLFEAMMSAYSIFCTNQKTKIYHKTMSQIKGELWYILWLESFKVW